MDHEDSSLLAGEAGFSSLSGKSWCFRHRVIVPFHQPKKGILLLIRTISQLCDRLSSILAHREDSTYIPLENGLFVLFFLHADHRYITNIMTRLIFFWCRPPMSVFLLLGLNSADYKKESIENAAEIPLSVADIAHRSILTETDRCSNERGALNLLKFGGHP